MLIPSGSKRFQKHRQKTHSAVFQKFLFQLVCKYEFPRGFSRNFVENFIFFHLKKFTRVSLIIFWQKLLNFWIELFFCYFHQTGKKDPEKFN
jgi:hypothetical protein